MYTARTSSANEPSYKMKRKRTLTGEGDNIKSTPPGSGLHDLDNWMDEKFIEQNITPNGSGFRDSLLLAGFAQPVSNEAARTLW